MKLISVALLMSLILVMTSCASLQSYPLCDVHSDTGLPILHPVAFNAKLISNQHVMISTADNQFEFLSQLEISQDRLVLVALTPIGQKLFQIQYRKQQLQFERFGIPDTFNPAFLLADVSLIYGDNNVLHSCYQQAGLPLPAINTMDKQRTVRYPGQEAISITYSTANKWTSDIVFSNPVRDYKIEIKSLGVEQL